MKFIVASSHRDCEWLVEQENPGDLPAMWARVYDRGPGKRAPRYAVYLSRSKKMLSQHAVAYGEIVAAIEAHYA
jgi:hypothetical protein